MGATISGLAFTIGFFAVLTGLSVFFLSAHSRGKQMAEAGSDLRFENALQQEISRSNASQWAPAWTAPKLPASVIAAIWTHRFIAQSTQPPTKTLRYESNLRRLTWDYRREAPYIVATALLSLRDSGLIDMFLEPRGKFLDSFHRVRVERTDQPLLSAEMPPVEGGLLLACLDIAHKRFGKSDQPSVYGVTREWIGDQGHPYKWVLDVATYQGRQLGLYEPAIKKRGLRADPPVFSMEHLAACEDQAVACVSRWQEFGVNEPELQQRLITEVSFGINGNRSAGGG